jgi:NAD(P)-dependent dehydrogenase (short-subunit alcohol dehydrogenase family)
MWPLSPRYVARAALPWLRQASWARIVNVSSIVSRLKMPELAPYGTAKAAIEALSKTMALTLAAEGILVNTVTPGAVVTEALKDTQDAGREVQFLTSGHHAYFTKTIGGQLTTK